MKRIFLQGEVNRSEEINDSNISIKYDSMIITRLFILRVITIALILRIVLRIVLIIAICIIMYIKIIHKRLDLDA